jgi:hypothetical protein
MLVGEEVYIFIRWSTTLLSKVNLPHAIDGRFACGANLVTLRSKFEPTKLSYSTEWQHTRGMQ